METGPLPIPRIKSLPETMDAVHAESDRLAARVKAAVDNLHGVSDQSYNILLTAALDIAELDYQLVNADLHRVLWAAEQAK